MLSRLLCLIISLISMISITSARADTASGIDQTEVTIGAFAEFVAATGFRTKVVWSMSRGGWLNLIGIGVSLMGLQAHQMSRRFISLLMKQWPIATGATKDCQIVMNGSGLAIPSYALIHQHRFTAA